ncbi:MAG: hypothetical protein D6813_09000 [Calditrichaeota bacterium]|nr:MAG: hypothetical protein D6813_09000 [Calditrichota bacterium]
MKILKLFCVVFLIFKINSVDAQTFKPVEFKQKCWTKEENVTLLGIMKKVIKIPLETVYKNNNYLQTFGCAYESDDIEFNSILAVYRAIEQSLRNRKITSRDNILSMLRLRPPRPDNLVRDYTIYVNLVKDSKVKQARYEIKILDLEVVPTFESKRSVWTRVITRFAYQDDYKNAPEPSLNPSEFVEVMDLAEEILEAAGKGKFKKVHELISRVKKPAFHPTSIQELVFGDYLTLFDEKNPMISDITGIYLGKGLYIAKIPKFDDVILKFGEERMYGLRIDTGGFHRATSLFTNLQYHAPEAILRCLALRFGRKKYAYLSKLKRWE